MNIKNIHPAAIAAGVLVIGGTVLFAVKRKNRCTKLPEIYDEDSAIHLTEDAQDQAFDAARYKIREIILSKDAPESITDVKLHVANALRKCGWDKLKTHEQKAVWNAISSIVEEVNAMAVADPSSFLQSF